MQRNIFLVSAVCFFVANNLHFIISSGFLPKLLDIVAMVALGFGVFVMIADRSGSEK
jgi:hypothetical protein